VPHVPPKAVWAGTLLRLYVPRVVQLFVSHS
jgi:hypothetical protein